MSTQTDVVADAGDSGEAALLDGLAEQLLAAAKAQGVALTGPGGLLTGVDPAGVADRARGGDERAPRA